MCYGAASALSVMRKKGFGKAEGMNENSRARNACDASVGKKTKREMLDNEIDIDNEIGAVQTNG